MIRFIFIGICLIFTASCSTPHKLNKNNNVQSNTKQILSNKSNTQNSYLIDKISNDHDYIKLLTPNEVLTLLGDPTLINKINNIEIWQYRKDFTLNIIWDKPNSLKSDIPEHKPNQNVDTTSKKANSSIIWLECVTRDKNQREPNHCFLKLTDF